MNDLIDGLMRMQRKSLSAEDLQSLGKQASNMYLHEGIPLTKAVVKLASEQFMTVEQVKRIVENANNATFLEAFDKQAGDKIVDFTPADPREVLRSLDQSARPPMAVYTTDYSENPTKLSCRDQELEADIELAKIFGSDPTTPAMRKTAANVDDAVKFIKTAGARADAVRSDLGVAVSMAKLKLANDSWQYKKANPFGELYQARLDLQKLAEEVDYAVGKNQLLIKEAGDLLTHEVKQIMLSDGNIAEVAHAMNTALGYDWTKTAMEMVIPRLGPSVINPTKARSAAIFYEMEKGAAARPVNLESPLLKAFAGFVEASEAQVKLAQSKQRIDKSLNEVEAMVAKAVRAENAAASR